MTWQSPKTNWLEGDVLTKSDFNRIEGNIAELKKAEAIEVQDVAGNFDTRNVEGALQELAGSVTTGKGSVASAITSMGQSASSNDTFAILANKIRDISKDANAVVGNVLSGKTFYQGGAKRTGAMPNRGAVVINPGDVIPIGFHNGSGYANEVIKSIQSGDVNFSGVKTKAVSISSVNVNNAIVLINFRCINADISNSYLPLVKLTNATTLTLERTAGSDLSIHYPIVHWQVIEFNKVKSIQRGDSSLYNTTSINVSISSVNVNNSIVLVNFKAEGGTSIVGTFQVLAKLTSATNLKIERGGGGNDHIYYPIVHWQVIEF